MEQEKTILAPELESLSKSLETSPEKFVLGTEEIRITALAAAKFVFDHGTSMAVYRWLLS
jgi:hypothetical protein